MTTHVVTEEQKALMRGQNEALVAFPRELAARQEAIAMCRRLLDEQADAVKKASKAAKDKVGADAFKGRLAKEFGYESTALKILMDLKKITDPEKLARVSRQVWQGMQDEGMLVPELFDETAMGSAPASGMAADKPAFDNTPKGSSTKGIGKAAAPKATPAPAPAGTGLGVPLDQALRELEAYKIANPPKRGAPSAEKKRLQAAVAAAQAAADGTTLPVPVEAVPGVAAATMATVNLPNADAPTDAELPELPSTTGPVSQDIAAGVAESQAHIAGQIAKTEPAKAPTKAQKAAAAKKGLAAALGITKETPPAAGPGVPPGEDDGEDLPQIPTIPRAIGTAPNTVRVG